jgi:hypothetical protein
MFSRFGTVVFHSTAVVVLGSMTVPFANAQVGAFSDYMPSGVDQFSYVLNRIQMQTIFKNAERRSSEKQSRAQAEPAEPVQSADTVIPLRQGPLGPRKLAFSYPFEQRATAEQTFTRLLSGYGSIESRFGIRRGDMAGAMAALIAGSLSACRDEDIPDAGFLEAVNQLRRAIGNDPEFSRTSSAEKQEAYEQFAILGTMLALTRTGLKNKPDAATEQRLRSAGCSYLDQFGIDPNAVSLTEKGLVAR